MSAVDVESRLESGVFPKRPLAFVRGEGARVWDADGTEYLDFGLNYGVLNVGHAHPRVVEAIRAQAERITYVPQTYCNDRRAEFLERLVDVAPAGLNRAFLANSGTEAIEAAIKFARGHTGRAGLVATKGAFHGRTLGALSLTHKLKYRKPFEPLIGGVEHVDYGDEEALKAAVTSDTAAVVLEPIQGEGGVTVPPPGYLRAARDLAHDAGALLVADEIQTGFARTGRFWACDHEGVSPDILCFAKSAAGGLPLGGILLADGIALPSSAHGNTFGGNPIACAAAVAVLDVIRDERLAERAEELGQRLVKGLTGLDHAAVREIRGRGLMVGLDLRIRNGAILQGLLERGVVALPTGSTVVRYLPPLVVSGDQVDRAVAATAEALGAS